MWTGEVSGSDVWVGGEVSVWRIGVSLSCHSPWVCGVWRGGRSPDRSSGLLDRSRFGVRLNRRSGVRFDRGLESTSNARSPDRSTGCEVDCFFFCSFSLARVLCFLFFLSLSLRFASHGNELK